MAKMFVCSFFLLKLILLGYFQMISKFLNSHFFRWPKRIKFCSTLMLNAVLCTFLYCPSRMGVCQSSYRGILTLRLGYAISSTLKNWSKWSIWTSNVCATSMLWYTVTSIYNTFPVSGITYHIKCLASACSALLHIVTAMGSSYLSTW